MATPTAEGASVGLGESRGLTELVLEMIALRHQMAVLKRVELVAHVSVFGIDCSGSCCPGGGRVGPKA